MTVTVDAVFEHGVIRPLKPIGLAEGTQVEVTVRTTATGIRFADRVLLPEFAALGPVSGDSTADVSADRDEV